MSKFVIRRKSDGLFFKTRTYGSPDWVDSIQNARVYGRRCDVSNSINCHFSSRYSRWRQPETLASDIEVLPVVLIQLNTGR